MDILFLPAVPKFNKLGCSRDGTARLWFQLEFKYNKVVFYEFV